MIGFLKPALFFNTEVLLCLRLKVGAHKTRALHLMLVLCQRALSPSKSNEQGWKEASAFISVLHARMESWKFLLSTSLSSLPWIPVWAESSLFQFYLGYVLITLILCTFGLYYSISNQPTKSQLASSTHLRETVEKGKCYKYNSSLPWTT